jgi:hypothetical protein
MWRRLKINNLCMKWGLLIIVYCAVSSVKEQNAMVYLVAHFIASITFKDEQKLC